MKQQKIKQARAVEILAEIADEIDGTVRTSYSGRGMYGRSCYGIVCDYARDAIEAAAQSGIVGAETDDMGLRQIAYWRRITGVESDPDVVLKFRDDDDDDEE